MRKFKLFRWQGSSKIYTLPFLKNRVKLASDSEEILTYAKCPFTRSRFVMHMISEFHLSQNSIVVSDDSHAKWLKRLSLRHMPSYLKTPEIAKDLMERTFAIEEDGNNEQITQISERLIRELYRTMLSKVLNVSVLKPLDDFISKTKFPKGSRPLAIEGLMYSFRLHLPFLRPIRWFFDTIFFRETRNMKRVSKKLEQMIFDYTIPNEDSWFKELSELKDAKKITDAQFKGEITSMLVSSFSLASALGSTLLCLAARPSYQKKIHKDPTFAKYFVMEVLRLNPPFRQFGYDRTNLDKSKNRSSGVESEFMIPVVELHRNSSNWKDPNKFYPERFLEPNSTKGFKYIPFGMGKRSCPGRKFSLSLITDSVEFVCSDESSIDLVKRNKMPQGVTGRLVSFAIDDTLAYRKKKALQMEDPM